MGPYVNKVRIDFSLPGKPTDNAHLEAFNGRLREECLNSHWFVSMRDAKQAIEAWRTDYNENRPHRARENRTPLEKDRNQIGVTLTCTPACFWDRAKRRVLGLAAPGRYLRATLPKRRR